MSAAYSKKICFGFLKQELGNAYLLPMYALQWYYALIHICVALLVLDLS
jgi:hypothetical protein